MPQGKDPEKTEPATAKRRADARSKGNVAQSREVSTVFILFGGMGVLLFSGLYVFQGLSDVMRWIFQNLGNMDLQADSSFTLFLQLFQQVFMILAPILLVILVAGIAANIVQVGFLFTTEPFIPKFSNFNPVSGIARLFSLKAFVELVKSLAKLAVVGTVALLVLWEDLDDLSGLVFMSVGDVLSFICSRSLEILFYTGLVLIIIAALDYAFVRWKYEQDLKMTKQEVKDERKAREGDPTVKGRIRKAQREAARLRMMEAVPTADVVVTNPTNLAIALKYDAERMVAPQVIAKGAGLIAERIRKIAEEKGIPIVENRALAQTLYKVVEIGQSIPVNLYKAVAELLAYVYRLREKKKKWL
jgi:flagellar biosynthetic protein FlhB